MEVQAAYCLSHLLEAVLSTWFNQNQNQDRYFLPSINFSFFKKFLWCWPVHSNQSLSQGAVWLERDGPVGVPPIYRIFDLWIDAKFNSTVDSLLWVYLKHTWDIHFFLTVNVTIYFENKTILILILLDLIPLNFIIILTILTTLTDLHNKSLSKVLTRLFTL